MRRLFSQCIIIGSIVLLATLTINTHYSYAKTLQEDAESYRVKGYEAQDAGDIDSAISWYQKSASLDPRYAAPHNDMGILFEAKGWLDRAEGEYLKALALEPDYEKAHANLALLYERKGELEKAAFHWMRRYKLGKPNDPWTYEARRRLEKLGLLDKETKQRPRAIKPAPEKRAASKEEKPEGWLRLDSKKDTDSAEQKTSGYKQKKYPSVKKKSKPIKEKKAAPRKSGTTRTKFGTQSSANVDRPAAMDKELKESLRMAEERLKKEKRGDASQAVTKSDIREKTRTRVMSSAGAKAQHAKAQEHFKKGEYSNALDVIRDAKRDYPGDLDLLELEQTVKNKMKEERIKDHYNEGILDYQKEDYPGARKEFEAILNIVPE
ncbi:MAG: hypothetical protein KKH08_02275 [Candidatus Omnitrophica bacterium]|nr:hypothetical protein [Candidatus Omnitrophota bacterium]